MYLKYTADLRSLSLAPHQVLLPKCGLPVKAHLQNQTAWTGARPLQNPCDLGGGTELPCALFPYLENKTVPTSRGV